MDVGRMETEEQQILNAKWSVTATYTHITHCHQPSFRDTSRPKCTSRIGPKEAHSSGKISMHFAISAVEYLDPFLNRHLSWTTANNETGFL